MKIIKLILSVSLLVPLFAFGAVDVVKIQPIIGEPVLYEVDVPDPLDDPIPEADFTLTPDRIEMDIAFDDDCNGEDDDCDSTEPLDMVMCTADAKICPDGSGVGRVGPNCEFALCPGEVASKEWLDTDDDDDGLLERLGGDCDDDCDGKTDALLREEQMKMEIESRGEGDAGGVVSADGDADVAELDLFDDNGTPLRGTISNQNMGIVLEGEKLRTQLQDGSVEVRGWDPVKKQVTLRVEDVKTNEDLNDFAQAIIVGNERIRGIHIEQDSFEFQYKEPAKLFWFINVEMKAKVEVDEVGEVKVKFPWYKFLTSSKASESREEIIDAVEEIYRDTDSDDDGFGDMGEEDSLRLQTTMDRQAKMIQTLSNIMKKISGTADEIVDNIK